MSSMDQNRGRTNEHVHAHTGVTTCDKGHSHMHLGLLVPRSRQVYMKDNIIMIWPV